MASLAKSLYTPEQYLEIERADQTRNEYVSGEMFAMSGASRLHNFIAGDTYALLLSQLDPHACEVYINDMRVNVGAAFFYPDVVVACGKIELLDNHADTLLNPTVIIEVLSKSTEAYDRGEKFARYSLIKSLRDFILVSQEQIRVEHFVRQPGDKWLLSVFANPTNVIEIESIGCRLTLADIYRRIEFPGSDDGQ